MSRVYNLRRSVVKPHETMMTCLDREFLPPTFDLRPKLPPALDQGELGSCASNAMSNALRFLLTKRGLAPFQPSRLYLYWNTRVNIAKCPADQDTGVAINDLCAALKEYHACDEVVWPYDIPKFSHPPPPEAYANAQLHTKVEYQQVPLDLAIIKQTLFKEIPILIGIMVYESLEWQSTMQSGIVPMPNMETENCLGGHCVLLTGWNDETQRFTFQNSWNDQVADQGYFTIPYEYVLNPNLGIDFWAVTMYE